uniref:Uncharacterized protein n=1 Tax=Aegilops tauschii TaxID=37682 RepID=M8CI08_AEGTA
MAFGFLDPVSNIIANTIAYAQSPAPGSDEEEEAPALEWILSVVTKIITDTKRQIRLRTTALPAQVHWHDPSAVVARRSCQLPHHPLPLRVC